MILPEPCVVRENYTQNYEGIDISVGQKICFTLIHAISIMLLLWHLIWSKMIENADIFMFHYKKKKHSACKDWSNGIPKNMPIWFIKPLLKKVEPICPGLNGLNHYGLVVLYDNTGFVIISLDVALLLKPFTGCKENYMKQMEGAWIPLVVNQCTNSM